MAATAAPLVMIGGSGRGNCRCGALSFPEFSGCADGGSSVGVDDDKSVIDDNRSVGTDDSISVVVDDGRSVVVDDGRSVEVGDGRSVDVDESTEDIDEGRCCVEMRLEVTKMVEVSEV